MPGRPCRPAQADVAARLRQAVEDGSFSVTLLDGVTGSGKTEVYLEAVAACLEGWPPVADPAAGNRAVGPVPGPLRPAGSAWPPRSGTRTCPRACAAPPGALVADGTARVVVGARSALFLPFGSLGLVVVDEEHETAFKQEDGVVYHARDMAVVRARLSDAPGRSGQRHPQPGDAGQRGGRPLPPFAPGGPPRRRAPAGGVRHRYAGRPAAARPLPLPPRLVAAVHETLAAGEQAMFFLNRRGYAAADPVPRLRSPAWACPNCTAWLVEHPRPPPARPATHCGHEEPVPPACPICHAEGTAGAHRPRRGTHHGGGRRHLPRGAPPGDGQRHHARPRTRRGWRPVPSRRARWI